MAPRQLDTELTFNGSNWEDLNRLVALSKFHFLQDTDYDDEAAKQCACLAQTFSGPALDWVASMYATSTTVFNSFDGFIEAVRQAFGVAENNITALCRKDLDELTWSRDTPVFFARFDRLTMALGISGHATKIAMVEAKLPAHIKEVFRDQALSFSNYHTMRERLNTMWALTPTHAAQSKPRCGSCHKKGHTSSQCKGGSKN